MPSTSPPHYSDYSRFSSSNSSQTVNSISESMISNSKSVNSLNQTPYQCQNCARLKLQLLDSGIDVSRSGYESFRESISENNLQAKNLVVRKPLKKVRSQSFIDQNLKEYHLYESQIWKRRRIGPEYQSSSNILELFDYVHFVIFVNKNIPYSHSLLNDDKNNFPATFPGNFDVSFLTFFCLIWKPGHTSYLTLSDVLRYL